MPSKRLDMDKPLVHYTQNEGLALIQLDDGKSNALSLEMIRALNSALDRAEADHAMVILTGRAQVFSAGFDLRTLRRGGLEALRMLHAGYAMTGRLLSYPRPVIAACNGHALAMGVFLLLSCDHIIAAQGDFKLAANEVAIGLPMPRVASAMLRHRLTPAAYQRAVTLAAHFTAHDVLAAGFCDELVSPQALLNHARMRAAEFAQLDGHAHTVSKQRIRKSILRRVRLGAPLDVFDAALIGLRQRKSQGSVAS